MSKIYLFFLLNAVIIFCIIFYFVIMGDRMYKFIDLFAGIGGFRLAFESLNCECVFSIYP